ncbi:caspase, EACC1-associated type [Streptomyces sp. NPDC002516]
MRRALLIGCANYSDAGLHALRAPTQDVTELAAVLEDQSIGDFDVEMLSDEPEYVVRRRIERYFAGAGPDDMLLLYLSGHGLRDEAGRLFFAASDTELGLLDSTAISAEYISGRMEQSFSQRIVVVLDCCFSGAFPVGRAHKSAEQIEVTALNGRGRAVLASSKATEYSFEGGALVKEEPVASIFTQVLVGGLRTGAADIDGDGWITVDDLYTYVHREVRNATKNQTPTRSLSEVTGTLWIARAPERPAAVPVVRGLPGTVLPTTAKSAAVVNCLPRSVPDFTGREEAMEQLSRLSGTTAGAVTIQAISGIAGVGKTQLAVQAAHLLADRYPDAQLYLDLQGFTPGRPPVDPRAALESLLREIEVPADRIPPDLDQRAALWRAQVADRRILLVLDNAVDEAQIHPLLPGAAHCLVLVTSRHAMVELAGAELLALDVLNEESAIALFRRLVRLPIEQADDPDVHRVVSICGGLPLAIRMAAGRLRRRPQLGVAGLAAELTDAQTRLKVLHSFELPYGGGPGVRGAFAMSYAALAPEQQLLFRRLGLHPGPEISVAAAAALAAMPSAAVERRLEDLLGQCLVQEPVAGRFTLHDLLRAYARERSADDDTGESRLDAERRLLALHLREAETAADALAHSSADESARREARVWLELERGNLTALAQLAQARSDAHAVGLAAASADHLLALGYLDDAETLYRAAAAVARALDDLSGLAAAHLGLADVERFTGRYEDAGTDYRIAQGIYTRIEQGADQSRALYGLGELARVTGDYRTARECFLTGIDMCAVAGARSMEADAWRGLGEVEQAVGDLTAAQRSYQRSVEVSSAQNYRLGQLFGLTGLGEAERALQLYDTSRQRYEAALEIAVEEGHRRGQMNALYGLGEVARLMADYRAAHGFYTRVFDGTRELDNRRGQAYSLIGLGQVEMELGEPTIAIARFTAAVEICSELGDRRGRARALTGLGDACTDNQDVALNAWQRAIVDYTALGLTENAEEVRERVTNLTGSG